ncbi:MAG: cell division protein ZapA [Nitrospirae bacterium]|nr:cell division protein ZapA [Nitrospirota bacterium]
MGNVEVHILGQRYIIKGDTESPEYLIQLAEFVDGKLKEVYSTAPHITPLKAAILAALNIADELHKIKKDHRTISQSIRTIEDKADTIIKLFE